MALGDYEKINFNNNSPPPLNSSNLNRMDSKIKDLDTFALETDGEVTALQTLTATHSDEIQALEDDAIVLDGRIDSNDSDISALQTLTVTHTDNLALLNPFKEYDPDYTYTIDEPCFFNGVPYKSLTTGNIGQTPGSSPTYWEVTGGGSGGVANPGYTFTNGNFESSVTGWIAYKDAAQVLPVDGTGGSPSITITRNSASPLTGTGDGLITKPASNVQGEGIGKEFTIDRGQVTNTAQVAFTYETSANYSDGYMGVYVYDVTNSNIIYPSIVDLPATYGKPSTHKVVFIPSTSNSYRLLYHVQTATTTGWTVKLDNVSVENKTVTTGAAVSEWISYTPTLTGFGTPTEVYFEYRRNGSDLEVQGRFVSGTTSATIATVSIPPGLTAKPSIAITAPMGSWYRNVTSATANKKGVLYCPAAGGATNFLYFSIDDYNYAVSPFASNVSGGSVCNASEVISIRFSIPISTWTSNINLISDSTEYASNSSTTDITDNTSFAYGPEGGRFPNRSGGTGVAKRIRFKTPYYDIGQLQIEVNIDGIWLLFKDRIGGYHFQYGASYGMSLEGIPGNPYEVYVGFGSGGARATGATYGSVGEPWTSYYAAGWKWRVKKSASCNPGEIPPLVRAEYLYGSSSAGSGINYLTKIEDTHSCVTTGASWKYTAPISGVYLVSGYCYVSSGNTNIYIFKNGLNYSPIAFGTGQIIPYTTTIRLVAGDYIYIVSDLATSSTTNTRITITRIGG